MMNSAEWCRGVDACCLQVSGVCCVLTLFWDSRLWLSCCWHHFSPNPHTPLLSISLKTHSSLHHWNTHMWNTHTHTNIHQYREVATLPTEPHGAQWDVNSDACWTDWQHTVKQRMEVLRWEGGNWRVWRKSIKMYSKWRKSSVWVFSYNAAYVVATEPANSRQAYKWIWTLIRPKLCQPSVLLCLREPPIISMRPQSKTPINIQI